MRFPKEAQVRPTKNGDVVSPFSAFQEGRGRGANQAHIDLRPTGSPIIRIANRRLAPATLLLTPHHERASRRYRFQAVLTGSRTARLCYLMALRRRARRARAFAQLPCFGAILANDPRLTSRSLNPPHEPFLCTCHDSRRLHGRGPDTARSGSCSRAPGRLHPPRTPAAADMPPRPSRPRLAVVVKPSSAELWPRTRDKSW